MDQTHSPDAAGAEFDKQLRYWKQQLHGAPSLLELPTDRPRPAVLTDHSARCHFELTSSLVTQLQALGRETEATLFMTTLAAFQTLLYRYSGHSDILVGSPIASRGNEPVNTLVLRTELSGNPTFRELLVRVRKTAVDAHAHPDVPLEKLVAELVPERSLSYAPLFQVVFALGHVAMAGSDTGSKSRFDLSVVIEERSTGLAGAIEYNTALFDAATVERMIGHYQVMLAGIVAAPDTHIEAIPMLPQAERDKLLFDWNDTARGNDDDTCMHELFEQQVDLTPDAIAVADRRGALTYRQLDERANQLAHELRALGAAPDGLVGIYLERHVDLVVALLGALKSGAAYVPLDPMYPRDRLLAIQEDARPKVLITETKLAGSLPDLGARRVLMDADRAQLDRRPPGRPARVATQSNLSHVIFTSGSTGNPKGVAIEHRVMVNYCRFSRELHPPAELRSFLFATSVCFDMSLFELFLPLSTGGRVFVVEDLFSLPSVPADAQLTFINAVPSVLTAYLRTGAGFPATLQAFSCAGEALSNTLVQQLHALGVPRVYDFYGPTETFIATWSLRSGDGAPTIGRPISNLQIYLLDTSRGLASQGARAELWAGGHGLARNYHGRPDLTDERFISNPFGPGRLYKTGDVVRWLPDGTLQYLGRSDHQVKIRGFRIEPGEVESVLRKHPHVRDVAVIAREDTPGDKRLVSYVVAAKGTSAGVLREHVKSALPDYMVPSAFVLLDVLPQTPNGKIDRKALPAPDDGALARDEYVAPRTPEEETLAQIWSELLGVTRVGVHDDFFALGGHSLLAVTCTAEIASALGVDLPVTALYEAPTIAELAAQLMEVKVSNQTLAPQAATDAIPSIGDDAPVPLAFSQRWFMCQANPSQKGAHLNLVLHLMGDLDVRALERAIDTVIDRHESLRTIYSFTGVGILQSLGDKPKLQFVDLSEHAVEMQPSIARAALNDEIARPYDFTRGPLYRALLLRLSDTEHYLLSAAHHSIWDGWSDGIFVQELVALYGSFQRGEEPKLQPLRVQLRDFAAWQARGLTDGELEETLAFWKERMPSEDSFQNVIRTDRPRAATQDYFTPRLHVQAVPDDVRQQAIDLARSLRVPPYYVYLSALAMLLAKTTGNERIRMATLDAARTRAEIAPVIGDFMQFWPIVCDLSSDPTFLDVVERVRREHSTLHIRGAFPPDELFGRGFRIPFQILVNFDSFDLEALALPGIQTSFDIHPVTETALPLVIFMMARSTRLEVYWQFGAELFDLETIESLASSLSEVLRVAVANPEAKLSEGGK